MVAVRVYPETSIAAEGALFWRILVEANEMAEDYAERWNLPAAEELVGYYSSFSLYDTVFLLCFLLLFLL